MLFPWIVVFVVRLLVPLTLFRWTIFGAFASIVADNLDVVILDFLHVANFGPYNQVDKILDLYYLGIECLISLKWQNKLARNTSVFLFLYRLVGTILYEITNIRGLLFIFPNLFENFFVFYIIYKSVAKKDRLTSLKAIIIVNLILLIPKEIQEYALHVAEFPVYDWIKGNTLLILRSLS